MKTHKLCLKQDKIARCDEHPTFYHTIVGMPEWAAWVKHQEGLYGSLKRRKDGTMERVSFDVGESTECGWISPKHMRAFCWFVHNFNNRK
jgi:hypothetical protein